MGEQQQPTNPEAVETWATVELGHGQTAGRISRPSDWGGLLRVDVPVNGGYRTEFYGMPAIYAVKLVSEEIACAFAQPVRGVIAYDTPIVTRELYEAARHNAEVREGQLEKQILELERRLVAVNQQASLPPPASGPSWDEGGADDKEADND